MNRVRRAGPLALVLLLAAALYVPGITWGLPSARGWAPDELVPADVLAAAEQRFGAGEKYPPLHYYVLLGLYAPVLAIDGRTPDPSTTPTLYFNLFLAGRACSLVLAFALLCVTARLAHLVYGTAAAGIGAALMFGIVTPLVYYAKLANLDVPYLLWFALAMLFYVSALRQPTPRDCAGLGLCAALAMATKDQAYGLFALMPLAVLVSAWRRRQQLPPARSARAFAVGLLVFVVTYALGSNLLLNPAGFRAHIDTITGPASENFRLYEPTLTGHFQLAWTTVRLVVESFGWPAAALVTVALVGELRHSEGRRRLAVLAVPALSYYLTFLSAVLYCYDRFVLPLCLLAALPAGALLARLWQRASWGRATTVAVVAYGIVCGIRVDQLMLQDSRYGAGHFLRHDNAAESIVAADGPLEYHAYDPPDRTIDVRTAEELVASEATHLVINADYARQLGEHRPERRLYRGLRSRELPFLRTFAAVRPSDWFWFSNPTLRARAVVDPVTSSLELIAPTIEVYRRR